MNFTNVTDLAFLWRETQQFPQRAVTWRQWWGKTPLNTKKTPATLGWGWAAVCWVWRGGVGKLQISQRFYTLRSEFEIFTIHHLHTCELLLFPSKLQQMEPQQPETTMDGIIKAFTEGTDHCLLCFLIFLFDRIHQLQRQKQWDVCWGALWFWFWSDPPPPPQWQQRFEARVSVRHGSDAQRKHLGRPDVDVRQQACQDGFTLMSATWSPVTAH